MISSVDEFHRTVLRANGHLQAVLRPSSQSAKLGMAEKTMVLHFLIQGRVQGVGFRWYVHREASELDLRGWVRNTEDGDVEVVASGEEADLAELRASLRQGPRGSRVDRLIEHYLEEKEAEGLSSFRIEGAW
jgi:acylphosphatase